MEITMDLVKALRERTAAGMTDCKKALEETGGELEKAQEYLVRKGLAKMKEKGKEALEGLVFAYVHTGGRIGVLVEVNSNTDFVARTDDFKQFVEDVALQIAAMNPLYISRDHVPAADMARLREGYLEEVAQLTKPQAVLDKIVDGKVAKWLQETCLLEQPFIKDDTTTLEKLRGGLITKTGENIQVRRFVRYALGEKV